MKTAPVLVSVFVCVKCTLMFNDWFFQYAFIRECKLERKKLTIGLTVAVTLVGLFVFMLASGAVMSSRTIKSTGVLASANLGVYSDAACTQSLASIDWGTISPGGVVTKYVYVKNTGAAQVTLSLSKVNWNPAAANGPLTLTWNQEGTVLASNQAVTAMLWLTVSPNVGALTTFAVDVVISGTG